MWHRWRFSRGFVTSVGHLLFRIANDALSCVHPLCLTAFKVVNRNSVRRRAFRHRHGDIPQAAEHSSAELSAVVVVVNLISAFHLRSYLWSLVISLDKDRGPAATLKNHACPHTSYSLSRPIMNQPRSSTLFFCSFFQPKLAPNREVPGTPEQSAVSWL